MSNEVKFKPNALTYREARRYAANGLLRVDPDDLIYLLEAAEEYGMEQVYPYDDNELNGMGLG